MSLETELLFSLIGIEHKKLKNNSTTQNKIEKLPNYYRKSIRDWISSSSPKPEQSTLKQYDYEKVVKQLEGLTPEKVFSLFENYENNAELALEYGNILELLRSLIPVNQSTTLFGTEDLPPSSYEQNKFLLKYSVFVEPEIVLNKLEQGTLTGLEIEVLKLFYPLLLELIQEIVVETIAELQGKGIKSVGKRKMDLINLVLEVPRLSPQKLQKLQANYTKEGEESEDVQIDAEAVQTDLQQTVNR